MEQTKNSTSPETDEMKSSVSVSVEGDAFDRELQLGAPNHHESTFIAPDPSLPPLRRSSSCPPAGSTPLSNQVHLQSWANSLVTQDDLTNHSTPTRTTMYRAIDVEPIVPPVMGALVPTTFPWIGQAAPFEWSVGISHSTLSSELPGQVLQLSNSDHVIDCTDALFESRS